MEPLKPKRAWNESSQILKDHNCQSIPLYQVKLSAIVEEERRTFHDIKTIFKKSYPADQN